MVSRGSSRHDAVYRLDLHRSLVVDIHPSRAHQTTTRVTTTETLGVIVDENITWKNLVDNICSTVSKRIGILKRAKTVTSSECLKRPYDALVLPHFDDCSLVWDNCTDSLKDHLQKLQNKAERVLTGHRYYDASATITRNKLGWEDLQTRRNKKMLSLVDRIIDGGSNPQLSQLFSLLNRDSYCALSLPKPIILI